MSKMAMAGAEGAEEPKGTDPDDKETKAGAPASQWHSELKSAATREAKWRKKGIDIVARFRQEKALELQSIRPTDKKLNILYSNTEVLLSHLCVDLGTPDVRRMFPQPGRKTTIARLAAEILEKTMLSEGHSADAGAEFEGSIEDSCLPGRGQVWLDLEEIEGSDPQTPWFKASICHVPWDMFRIGAARKWREAPWCARGHLFSKDDLEKEFPKEAKDIPLNYELENSVEQTKQSAIGETKESVQRSLVWEIWDKDTRSRIYVAEDYPKILKVDDDPYKVEGFFPCPEPLYMIKTTNSMVPIPLYLQYEDAAEELNRLCTRSYRLTEALKYCGIYGQLGDDTLKDIGNLEDGEFMPFKNFSTLQQSGGLAAAFMVRNLSEIVPALQAVDAKIDVVVQRIYELSGISDLMRGDSDPATTATAEKIKARFGGQRSSRRQRIVQRFVREAYRIKAELVAEHYSPGQLSEMTGIPLPTRAEQDGARQAVMQVQAMAQQGVPNTLDQAALEEISATLEATPWEDIAAVIRSNARRMFMVDVETDDTAFEDDQAAKEGALEFMTQFFATLQQVGPAVAAHPELMGLAKELVTYVATTFKVGQAFEDAINDAFDKLAKAPPQPAAPADPTAAAQASLIQAQAAKAQADMAINQQKAQADLMLKQQEAAINLQIKQIDLQLKQIELQIKKDEVQTKAVGNQIDLQSKIVQHQQKAQQDVPPFG